MAVPMNDNEEVLRIGALRSAAAFVDQFIVAFLKLRVLDISGFPKMPGCIGGNASRVWGNRGMPMMMAKAAVATTAIANAAAKMAATFW